MVKEFKETDDVKYVDKSKSEKDAFTKILFREELRIF